MDPQVVRQVRRCLRLKQTEEARRLLVTSASPDSWDGEGCRLMGESFASSSPPSLSEALPWRKRAVVWHERNGPDGFALASVLVELGDLATQLELWDLAYDSFLRVRLLRPDGLDRPAIELVNAAFRSERFVESLSHARAELSTARRPIDLFFLKYWSAESLRRLGRAEECEAATREAIEAGQMLKSKEVQVLVAELRERAL